MATNSTINLVILNDISSKDIAKINDNRIFKIWGCINNDGKDTMVHYFDYIVDNLFPNIDATKNQEMLLKKFIDYYNENLSK